MKSIKKLIWISLITVFFISITMVNAAVASPQTYLRVDPPVIGETPTGKFEIQINVVEAPSTYAWEVILKWDPTRLELVSVTEGDFLHRWMWDPFEKKWIPKYATTFVYDGGKLDEANLMGNIRVGSSLKGALPQADWASGNGLLATLGFLAQKRGDAYLELSDARLWDHLAGGYPVYTPYSSVGGLVTVTNFYYAGLTGWKLKVNGKSGVSEEGGLKSMVGAENPLEAWVANPGAFDVNVQVSFEIRDAAGYPVATIKSGIEFLPAGASLVFSATWIGDEPNIYRITAYSFYGELLPTIPDGFSKTVRLKVV